MRHYDVLSKPSLQIVRRSQHISLHILFEIEDSMYEMHWRQILAREDFVNKVAVFSSFFLSVVLVFFFSHKKSRIPNLWPIKMLLGDRWHQIKNCNFLFLSKHAASCREKILWQLSKVLLEFHWVQFQLHHCLKLMSAWNDVFIYSAIFGKRWFVLCKYNETCPREKNHPLFFRSNSFWSSNW